VAHLGSPGSDVDSKTPCFLVSACIRSGLMRCVNSRQQRVQRCVITGDVFVSGSMLYSLKRTVYVLAEAL
jgi:ABC-type phosphate transport system ATPase subunit